ncbi:aminotransferase class IV, partial [Salmonella enterica]|uniref:aminotransferase class IV n=1 Tax=Salmonella enterica TaxID=28901 RepID=UPI00329757B7
MKNQSVFTTPLSEGPVDGVMRRHIITTLNNSPYRVTEIPITPEELLEADEIFLTNAIRGVMSVGEFLGKK